MLARSRPWLVGLSFLGTALTVGATPLAACDPVWLPLARPDGVSLFVALALAETVLDTVTGPIAARAHPFFAGRLDVYSGRARGGQRVRLLRWPEVASRESRDAVLVPWAYGSDCRPIEWSDRLDWIPAGTRGVVAGWLRPREHWLEGLPTFDVEMAWREPVWVRDEPRWSGDAGGGRMTPEEFLELYSALPTVELLERAPDEAAARLRDWEGDHPALAARPPAPTVLGHVYRVAADRTDRTDARQSLAGRWLAEVELLEGLELPLPTTARTIRGELDLGAMPPTHVGTSTLDFAPLGFRLGSGEVLVIVDQTGVRLILDPNVDHGHVAATVTGGTGELVGTWYLNSRPARASGTIRLRRPTDR